MQLTKLNLDNCDWKCINEPSIVGKCVTYSQKIKSKIN